MAIYGTGSALKEKHSWMRMSTSPHPSTRTFQFRTDGGLKNLVEPALSGQPFHPSCFRSWSCTPGPCHELHWGLVVDGPNISVKGGLNFLALSPAYLRMGQSLEKEQALPYLSPLPFQDFLPLLYLPLSQITGIFSLRFLLSTNALQLSSPLLTHKLVAHSLCSYYSLQLQFVQKLHYSNH